MQKIGMKGCERVLATLLLTLLAGFSVCPALAANAEAVLSLPISQKIEGGSAAVRYRMEAYESDAPLPGGAKGAYTFSLEDSVDGKIDAIRFDREGTWHYELSVLGAGNDAELLSSSPRRYRITVEVDEQSGKLYALAVVYDTTGDKRDQIYFKHTVASPTSAPTTTPLATATPAPTATATAKPATTEGGGTSVGTAPRTGDDANLPLYIGVMCATALAICIILILRKKKKV